MNNLSIDEQDYILNQVNTWRDWIRDWSKGKDWTKVKEKNFWLGRLMDAESRAESPASDFYKKQVNLELTRFETDQSRAEKDTMIDIVVIDKLFEKYGNQFPGETLEIWQQRFIFEDILFEPKLNLAPDTKGNKENNRLLIYTILKEIEDFKIKYHESTLQYGNWASNRFNLNYRTSKSVYKKNDKIHSKSEEIREILELRQQFADK